ncbi:IS3 family transposase [Oligella urethralis]|nr:IS3 family transposase [Oligella urethralis]
MDNGPELIINHMMDWAKEKQITLLHIQPGKPQQKLERFFNTVST